MKRLGWLVPLLIGVWGVTCAEAVAVPPGINVKTNYGARGDGVADDTAALQAAFNTLSSVANSVYIPPGIYKVSSTLTVADAQGFTIYGAGQTASQILPTTGVAGAAVVEFINCRDGVLWNLGILGYSPAPPSSGIEFHRAAYGGYAPTNMTVRDVLLGSVSANSLVAGVRWTADVDSNNSESLIENVKVINCQKAAYSIEHSNSLQHRIIGGVIDCSSSPSSIGVLTHGGSFSMTGTTVAVSGTFVVVTGRQYHSLSIANVSEEDGANILWTSTDSAIDISFTAYNKSGAKPNQSTIYFQGKNGRFSMSSSNLNLGQPGEFAVFTDPGTVARFRDSSLGIGHYWWAGRLVLSGNVHNTGAITLTPANTSAAVAQWGDFNGSVGFMSTRQ